MRTKIVINPTAGRGRAGKLLPSVRDCLARYGVEGEFSCTEKPGHGTELAFEAALAGYERIVSMGGDGTAVEVTKGLLRAAGQGHQTVLGVIPAGSGNDFAYAVGIPSKVEQACRRLAEGEVRTIDLIRVTVDGESHVFINAVGVGLDADVLLETRRMQRLRGLLLYLGGVLRVWATDGRWPYQVRVTIDGNPLPNGSITLTTISNGPRSGGGFYLNPAAQVTDGLLDVCVADQIGRWQFFPLLLKAMRGTHTGHRVVTMLRGRHVLIESESGVPGHMDGEVLCTSGHRIEFEVLPSSLKVWT